MAADKPMSPTCSQCGRTAIVEVNDVPLCVDCYTKLKAALMEEVRHRMAMSNRAVAELESIAGVRPGLFPRVQIPPLPSAPLTLNNIKLDNSVVGSINTGNVQTIDVNLTYLHSAGNDRARDALKVLTEAIVNDASISDTQKNELLDHIAFLSEQSVASAKDRKPGVIKTTINALTEAAHTVTSIAGAWQVAEPILRSLLG